MPVLDPLKPYAPVGLSLSDIRATADAARALAQDASAAAADAQLGTDYILTPTAGATITVPAGYSRVVLRGGATHCRLVLPNVSATGRLRVEVEGGSRQTTNTIQFIPSGTDTITDGILTASRIPISVTFGRATALTRSAAGVWTIGDAAGLQATMTLDLVNGVYRYGYVNPPAVRTLAQMLTFTNGATGSTQVGPDGFCRNATANTLRETYDPSNGAYLGPLFEPRGENWFPNPTNSSGFAVNKNNLGSPALSTDVPPFYPNAPVYKITPEDGGTNAGSISVDVPGNSIVCVSLMVWIPPECSGTLNDIFEIRNVTAGLTTPVVKKALFDRRACWQPVHCVIQNASAAAITSQVRFIAGGIRGIGDAQYPFRDMYVCCPQAERGVDFPSSFIPNATATVPAVRAADTVAFAANQPIDTLSGVALVAEMIVPALRQSGPGPGIGLGNDALGTVSAMRLRAYGDPAQPYLDAPLTGPGATVVAQFRGPPLTPGRPFRAAYAVSENDNALADGLGGRATQTAGTMPSDLGLVPIIDAASGPLILRSVRAYRG